MSNKNGPGGPYLSTKMVRRTDFVDIFGPPGPFLGGIDFCMTGQTITTFDGNQAGDASRSHDSDIGGFHTITIMYI